MSDTPNTVATLNGLFKKVYAPSLKDLVPDFAILQKRIPFSKGERLGDYFLQPVNLSHECGFTYNGEAGAVATLNDAVAGTMKEAQIRGSELILRGQLSYTALSRSAGNEASFKRASKWKIEDMNSSMRKRLELAMLYGQKGVGTVSAYASDVITITDATWAGGIWAGAESTKLDIYQSDLSTLRSSATNLNLVSVDSDAKTLTITTGHGSTPAATDVLFFYGSNSSGTFNEMAGLQKIMTATSTIFNISPTTYSLWKGNSVTSVGALTHGKIQDAVAKAVNKGLMESVLALVSPKAWSVLNTDQASLRMFDSSYKTEKAENGSESLVFHSTNGKIEIVSHPMVKDGDAFLLPLDSLQRVGSSDVTFGVPGMEEDFFTLVSGKSAIEIQCMADQAIFCDHPAWGVYMSGITYS